MSLAVQLSGESAEVRREWLVTGALEVCECGAGGGGVAAGRRSEVRNRLWDWRGNCLKALFNADAAFSGFPNSNGTAALTSAQD